MTVTPSVAPKRGWIAFAPHTVGLVGLVLFSVPIFFLALPWLGLYNDDWYFLRILHTNWQELFLGWGMWTRPVGGLPWVTARLLFDTYIPGYYLILFTLQVGAAGLLFLTLLGLRPRATGWALAASALFLVFPNDQTRFWLSTFVYRLGMFLLLLSTYLAGRAAASGRKAIGILALLCYALAAFTNEVFLPLLVVPALVQWERSQSRSFRNLVLALLPYTAIVLLYGAYRLGMSHWAGWPDAKAGAWQWSWDGLSYKLRRACDANLHVAWEYSWQRLQELPIQGLLVIGAGCLLVIGFLVALYRLPNRFGTASPPPTFREARTDILLAVVGLLLMYLAYLPILPTVYGITLGNIDSRVSAAAGLGAALAVTSLLHAFASLLGAIARWRWLRDGLFALMATALLVLAAGQQYAVRQDYALAWNKQCDLWDRLLAQVPGFQGPAHVLIANVPETTGSTRILTSTWEVSSALQLLYDNQKLWGDVIWSCYLPISGTETEPWKPQFRKDYFQPRESSAQVSYEHLVLVEYRPEGQSEVLYNRPSWAAEHLTELRTHPATIAEEPVTSRFREVLQSPFGWPWE